MQLSPGVWAGPRPTFLRFLLAIAIPFAILCAALPRTASGQDTLAPAVEPPQEQQPRFMVELIVFTYGDSVSAGSEIFVPERLPVDALSEGSPEEIRDDDAEYVYGTVPGDQTGGVPNDASTGTAAGTPEVAAVDDGPEPRIAAPPEITGDASKPEETSMRQQIELERVEPDEYTLDSIYDDLVNLDVYRPIMRTAWIQTAVAEDLAPAIRLRALGDPPPGLDGTVTLYQGRFLHLGVDLALDAHQDNNWNGGLNEERREAQDEAIVYGDARVQSGTARSPYGDSPYDDSRYSDRYNDRYNETGRLLRMPLRYYIDEVRIMKNGDIRYFDHPRFGVIAKVTKLADDDNAESAGENATTNGD